MDVRDINEEKAKTFFKYVIIFLLISLFITISIKSCSNLAEEKVQEPLPKEVYFSYINSNLKMGDEDNLFNSDVERLQRFLNSLGYRVRIDGVFGIETKKALMYFQKDYNIKPVDGVLGPKTREVINTIVRKSL